MWIGKVAKSRAEPVIANLVRVTEAKHSLGESELTKRNSVADKSDSKTVKHIHKKSFNFIGFL